jgi:ABC-type uncharacterized transport system permease subunit
VTILTLSILTCLALLAAAGLRLAPARLRPVSRTMLAIALVLAIAAAYLHVDDGGRWRSDFAAALWLIVAACLVVAVSVFALRKGSDGLVVLLGPLLALLGGLGIVWASRPRTSSFDAWGGWLIIHVTVSLVTFGLVTLAAVAGVALMLQSRFLKTKTRGAMSRALPSVSEGETLEIGLMLAAAGFLAVGIATGFAEAIVTRGTLLPLDHKTVLSVAGFIVIGGLLGVHHIAGIRGRLVARLALAAYLLLLLAYPGVKFVTDILIAPSG